MQESFFEDAGEKEMRYVSNIPSDFYVDVAWEKRSRRWRTCKFEGRRPPYYAIGEDFETVMKVTLAVGLQPDEPAD
jgi:hypothetical protein